MRLSLVISIFVSVASGASASWTDFVNSGGATAQVVPTAGSRAVPMGVEFAVTQEMVVKNGNWEYALPLQGRRGKRFSISWRSPVWIFIPPGSARHLEVSNYVGGMRTDIIRNEVTVTLLSDGNHVLYLAQPSFESSETLKFRAFMPFHVKVRKLTKN